MIQSPIRRVRVSVEARDQLIRLKRFTGVQSWSVLCRWALLRSLREEHPPASPLSTGLSNIEMDWEVFAGPLGALPLLLVRKYNADHGLGTEDAVVAEQLNRHLHRGIATLAASGERIGSIEDLIRLAVPRPPVPDFERTGRG